jgi:maleate isomerase
MKCSAPESAPEYGPVFVILTPQANTTVEPELQLLLPGTMLAARSISSSPDSRQRLLDYFDTLGDTLAQFDVAPVRAAGFACTGSSYLVGRAREDAVLTNLNERMGYPVISATQAIRMALQALGAKRIAMLAPYPAWLAQAARGYWQTVGIEITHSVGLPTELLDTRGIYALTTARISEVLTGLSTEGCDAVLLSGTGMPTLRSIASAAAHPPMLSSNLCLAWAMQAALKPAMNCRDGLVAFLVAGAAWRERLAARP